jgi:adenylate kinase
MGKSLAFGSIEILNASPKGAPGSGKGTHTGPILRARGITNSPMTISSILAKEKDRELIDKGQMISNTS